MLHQMARLCFVLSVFGTAQSAYSIPQYRVISIGNLPGFDGGSVADINQLGQVVGTSFSSTTQTSRAFLFDPTTGLHDLGVLPGDASSQAFGMNDRGEVVGTSRSDQGSRAFLYSPTMGMASLGSLPGWTENEAHAINNLGTVVGKSYNRNQELSRGFIYTSGTGLYDPGLFAGSVTEAQDVNDSNTIVWHKSTPNVTVDTYLYDANGVLHVVPGLQPGGAMNGQSINNLGDVAGTAIVTDSLGRKSNHAVLSRDPGGLPTDLGFLPGRYYMWASGMNDLDQIVGNSGLMIDAAFLYSEGSLYDINALLDLCDPSTASFVADGGRIPWANAINDAGWIAARVQFPAVPLPGGSGHVYVYPPPQAVLLAPVPEPTTAAQLAVTILTAFAALHCCWRMRPGPVHHIPS